MTYIKQSAIIGFLILIMIAVTPSHAQKIPIVTYPPGLSRTYTTTLNVYIDPQLQSDVIATSLSSLNGDRFSTQSPYSFVSTNQLEINQKSLSEANRTLFVDYLKTIEDTSSPNGHAFNATAYDEGKSHVFTNITGRSFDAEKALNWIDNNLWDKSTNTYSLYVFNFTDLDSGMDHWFKVDPIDRDTEIPQSTFFSGTSGLVYGKSVSAWGGHAGIPVHFIDLSSETWWGDFLNHIYSKFSWSADIISHKLQDFTNQGDRDAFIGDYLSSFIGQTYDLQLFNSAPLGRSVKVQTIVLYDWYDYGYSINNTRWILNSDKIKTGFETAFPYLDFNVTDQWYNLSNFGNLQNEMSKYTTQQPDGSYYLELNNGLLSYIGSIFNPQHFDYSGEDIVLPSLVFLLNNTTFTYGGLPIAGLGGMGWQLQGLTPSRYLSTNGTHLRGFSDVILHEVGHSLGLPHPFTNYDNWAGDFVASVMGYYTSAPDFSQYDINAMGFYHSNSFLTQAEYVQDQQNYESTMIPTINNWIKISQTAQNNWDFNKSIAYSNLALCGYAKITNTSDSYCDASTIQNMLGTVQSNSEQVSSSSSTKTPFLMYPSLGILLLSILKRAKKQYS